MKDLKSDSLWGNIDKLIIDVAALQKIKGWKHVLKIKSSTAKTADVIYLKILQKCTNRFFLQSKSTENLMIYFSSQILWPEASQRLDNKGKREISILYSRMSKNASYFLRNINK